MHDTKLPAAVEAEREMVASLLHHSGESYIGEVARVVQPADLSDATYRAILDGIYQQHARGEPINLVFLRRLLHEEDGARRQEVCDAMEALADVTPTGAHAPLFARDVAEAVKRRRLKLALFDAQNATTDGITSRDILANLGSQIFELQRGGKDKNEFCFGDVEPHPIEWLWDRRIPFRAITLIEADPAAGKSQLTSDIIARATTGRPMPPLPDDGFACFATDCILLNAEDSPSQLIRPRLDAAGADPSRVHGLKSMVFPKDLDRLRETMERHEARLAVIDPVTSYIDNDVDAHADAAIRSAILTPLAEIAEDLDAAIVCIRHLNKSPGGKAMYRGGGSIAYTASARSVMVLAPNPDAPNERVLASVKSNLAPPGVPLAFEIEPVGWVSRVRWVGERDGLTADVLVKPPKSKSDPAADAEKLFAKLPPEGLAKTPWKEQFDWGWERFNSAFAVLENEGRIRSTGRRGAPWEPVSSAPGGA